jgi:hypothetical protein
MSGFPFYYFLVLVFFRKTESKIHVLLELFRYKGWVMHLNLDLGMMFHVHVDPTVFPTITLLTVGAFLGARVNLKIANKTSQNAIIT